MLPQSPLYFFDETGILNSVRAGFGCPQQKTARASHSSYIPLSSNIRAL